MKVFYLFIIIFTFQTFGYEKLLEAEVVVLEAPVFRIQNAKSQVVQYLRKGEVIRLHPIHDIGNPLEVNYVFYTNVMGSNELVDLEKYFIDEEKRIPFYKTIDRNGRPAFVLKQHIKPIYNDIREYKKLVSNYLPDQTDYRIQEPLPKGYPIFQPRGFESSFLLGVGLASSYQYQYANSPNSSNDQMSQYFTMNSFKQADDEVDSRLSYGFEIAVAYFKRITNFANGETGQESLTNFGIGPGLSYDFYRGDKNLLSFQGSIILNLINQYQVRVGTEKQKFKDFTLVPTLKTIYRRRKIIKDFDFTMGPQARVIFPGQLSLSEGSIDDNLQDISAFEKDLAVELSFMFGITNSF